MSESERARGTAQVGPYEIALELLVPKGMSPEITAYAVRHTERKVIPASVRRDLERQLSQVADWIYARAKATKTETLDLAGGRLTLKPKDGEPASVTLTEGQLTGTKVDLDREAEMRDEMNRRRRRRHITPELLAEVSEIYRSADPLKPTEAVKDHWVVSKATASRWVKAAREEGLLD